MVMHNWASLNHRLGNRDHAEKLYTKSLILREKYLGHRNIEVASSLTSLAAVKVSLNQHEEARRLYSRALVMLKDIVGEDHQAVAYTATRLGVLLETQKCYDEAIALFAESLHIDEKTYGRQHEQVRKAVGRIHRAAAKHAKTLRTQKQLVRFGEEVEKILGGSQSRWPSGSRDSRPGIAMETTADLMATSQSISSAIAPETSHPGEQIKASTSSFRGFVPPSTEPLDSSSEFETPTTIEVNRGQSSISKPYRMAFSGDPPVHDVSAIRRHPSLETKTTSLMGTTQTTSELNFAPNLSQDVTKTVSHAYPMVHDNSQFGIGLGSSVGLETPTQDLPYSIPSS